MTSRQWILLLWPSFIAATMAESVFFAFFDPEDLAFLGEGIRLSRTAVYSIGLFFFWALAALSSAMTIYLAGDSRALRKQRAHS
jgi:hypothetical protein